MSKIVGHGKWFVWPTDLNPQDSTVIGMATGALGTISVGGPAITVVRR